MKNSNKNAMNEKCQMKQIIEIEKKEFDYIKELLNMDGEQIYQKYGLKRDETIIHTVNFGNGIEADIKLVICEDCEPYTEGVLFRDGSEIACAEVNDDYFCEWCFEDHGIQYIVEVKQGRNNMKKIDEMTSDELFEEMTSVQKDDIYRRVWYEHVYEDCQAHLEYRADLELDEEKTDELCESVAISYVYNGRYDCNLSYWSNIDNLIDEYATLI